MDDNAGLRPVAVEMIESAGYAVPAAAPLNLIVVQNRFEELRRFVLVNRPAVPETPVHGTPVRVV